MSVAMETPPLIIKCWENVPPSANSDVYLVQKLAVNLYLDLRQRGDNKPILPLDLLGMLTSVAADWQFAVFNIKAKKVILSMTEPWK